MLFTSRGQPSRAVRVRLVVMLRGEKQPTKHSQGERMLRAAVCAEAGAAVASGSCRSIETRKEQELLLLGSKTCSMRGEAMDILTMVSLVAGVVVAIFGIFGGLLSLPTAIRKLRRDLQPHGNKGMVGCTIKRIDLPDRAEVTYLVADDLIHFLRGFADDSSTEICSVESVGEYYRVIVNLQPGAQVAIRRRRHSPNSP